MASTSLCRALRNTRTYATAATKSVQGLSGKYASALFTAALKKDPKVLSTVEKDVTSFQKVLSGGEGPSIKEFLQNPTLQSAERKRGISDMLSKLSSPPNELTQNLLSVLAENGRLYETEKVMADFLSLMSAHRGEITITITSAQPLDSATQSRLETSLKKSVTAQGKTVKVNNVVNAGVMGGLVVDFGDKTIDLSVSSRVNKLNALLTESI